MTTHSHELFTRAKRSLAAGVSSSFRATVRPEPLFVDYGQGAYLVDVDGVRYTDFTLAWGPLILGHSHPAIIKAVQVQLERGSMFGAQHQLEIRVAERVQASIPCAELVTYSNSGSEAVLVALRLARAYTGRSKVIKFEGQYHGWTDSILFSYHPPLTEAGPPEHPHPVPESAGQVSSAMGEVIVLPWNDVHALEDALRQHGSEVAAVITEPAMCNSGIIAPTDGYLKAMRTLTQQYNTLLIFDEVITGFRLAFGGGQEFYHVVPDIAIYGKAIAGGFPLSMVVGRHFVMDQIANGTVQHSGTYNGNPISLAAAEATMIQLAQPGVYTRFHELGSTLAQGARALLAQHGLPALVHQLGPMMRILFTGQKVIRNYRDVAACNGALNTALAQELRLQGMLILPDGRWYLSTAHREDDVQGALRALDVSLAKLAAAQTV